MSLPISSVVDVSVTITPAAPPKIGFGIAAMVSSELPTLGSPAVQRVTTFNSSSEVSDVYPLASEAYKASLAYFSQSPSPDTYAVIAQYLDPTLAVLTGATGVDDSLAVWNAITDASFGIDFSGVVAQIQSLNFQTDVTMDDVAATIQAGIQAADASIGFTAATCTWDSDNTRFIITSGEVARDMSFTTAGLTAIDLSPIMLTGATDGGFIVQGRGPEGVVDALTAAEQADPNWYGIITQAAVRDTSVAEDVAEWTEARIKVYTTVSHNPNTLIVGNTDNIATRINVKNYTRTTVVYSSIATEYVDAAMFGKAFTVDFSSPDSVITLKFKTLVGITAENITSNQKNGIDEKRANAHIIVGGVNFFAESFMATQLFFDERHGVDWLTGEMEFNVFTYLYTRPTKVPLTDAGTSALVQQVIRTLDLARRNGLVAPGTTSEGVFLPNGYTVTYGSVADLSASNKSTRTAPTINFTALLAGAVHFVQINGVLER